MAIAGMADLHPEERMTLLGLLRVIVRIDGSFTAEEIAALTALSRRLGTTDFWAGMTECQTIFTTRDQVMAAAEAVQRDEARRFVYDCVAEVAHVDGIDPRETDLLDALKAVWGLSEP